MATGPTSVLFVASREGGPRKRLVAVKVLQQKRQSQDLDGLFRLRDRSRDLAQLHQRHIVCAEEVCRVGDHLALTFPYIDGLDLLDWVEVLKETGTPMPGRVVCEVVKSTANALDAANNRSPSQGAAPLGQVHQDIKPTNIMVDRDGELKVLDFGTGYTALAGRSARAGALQKGLVKYLSPGRRDGKRPTPAGDIYALGILAVELFRGRWLRRLRGNNPAHDRHLAEVVASMSSLGMRSGAEEQTLRNILLRMVAYDPEARPSASEVAATFRTLADRAPGPSLETFAHAHAIPWLEPIPTTPDPEVEAQDVVLLGKAMLAVEDTAIFERPTGGGPDTDPERWGYLSTTEDEPTEAPPDDTLNRSASELHKMARDAIARAKRQRRVIVEPEAETVSDIVLPERKAPVEEPARPVWDPEEEDPTMLADPAMVKALSRPESPAPPQLMRSEEDTTASGPAFRPERTTPTSRMRRGGKPLAAPPPPPPPPPVARGPERARDLPPPDEFDSEPPTVRQTAPRASTHPILGERPHRAPPPPPSQVVTDRIHIGAMSPIGDPHTDETTEEPPKATGGGLRKAVIAFLVLLMIAGIGLALVGVLAAAIGVGVLYFS